MSNPDHRLEWLIVLGLSLGPAISNGIARFAYGLVLPAMKDDLSWNYTEAGWINTANAMGYLLGALIALRLIRSVGPRKLFVVGMAVTTVSLFLSAITSHFWFLTFCRIMAGVGGAPVFIAGGVLASSMFVTNPVKNALAIAMYFGGAGLGMLISGMLFPLIISTQGVSSWPVTWLISGALSAVALGLSAKAVKLVPVSQSSSASIGPTAKLPVGKMSLALLGYFLFAVGYIVYITFVVAWMNSNNVSTAVVILMWSTMGIFVILSPFPWKAVMSESRGGFALSMASIATGIGTLLPLFMHGSIGLVLSAAIFGISFFIAPSAVTSFGKKNLDQSLWGKSVALFTTVFAVGQIVGPVLAGYIADQTESIRIGLFGAGLVLVAAGFIAIFQKPLAPSDA